MTTEIEVRDCSNCGNEHEFFYGWPRCDPSLPHGYFVLRSNYFECTICDKDERHPIHDRSGASQIKHCTNCGKEHWFISGWPDCDPHQPHGFMTYTGMEGRCQFCSGMPDAYLHRGGLR